MKIRLKTLWRVPVFCLAAGWLTSYITIHMGWFFAVQTPGEDGVINVSVDPIRGELLHAALFALVLLIGGLWLFRSMTRAEIAVSATIVVTFYLIIVVAELIVPNCFFNVSPSLSIALILLQDWKTNLSSLLWAITDQFELSLVVSCFAPFLFVPFGRKAAQQETPG